MTDLKTKLAPLTGQVARTLLGEPGSATKRELRYGTNGSLSVDLEAGRFYDHEAGEGGGLIEFVKKYNNCDHGDALDWLRDNVGADLPEKKPRQQKASRKIAEWVYHDENRNPLIKVTKRAKENRKTFSQQHWDARAHTWRKGITGVRRVLYRLPELRQAVPHKTVLVCEGEKDVDTVAELGFVGTTCLMGAGKWQASYNAEFAGAHVVVCADADEAGRKHAHEVARQINPHAASVRVIEFPEAGQKADVTDWVELRRAAGCERKAIANELRARAKQTEYFAPAPDDPPAGGAELYGEDALADRFTRKHGDDLRFDHEQGYWFRWDGARWRMERTGLALDLARHVVRDVAAELGPDDGAKLCKANTAGAVVRLAAADRAHAVTADVWDGDKMLLGTPGGTVDLRTGKLRDAARDDKITKLATVTPAFGRTPQRWLQFLREATGYDLTLVQFLQQMCGYCLTGDVSEHALFFLYGPGGNGKSVFLETLNGILSEYAQTASMDTFTASAADKHTTDLAMLRGARLVSVSETEEGRAWAETRIKQLTGGDEITARFMRQDNFTFKPQFKLVIVGNHRPVLRNVDDAARRRFNIIPFDKKPPEKDPHLDEKLREEWPEILAWMIEGARSWQENGLQRPDAVVDETKEYFEAQDTFGQWLEECCEIGKNEWEAVSKLYQSWSAFAERQGDRPGSQKAFADKLSKHGYTRYRETVDGKQIRAYSGLSIKFDPAAAGIDHE